MAHAVGFDPQVSLNPDSPRNSYPWAESILISPRFRATLIASVRPLAFNFSRTCVTWTLTVLSAMSSRHPISLLLLPCTRARSNSISRDVSSCPFTRLASLARSSGACVNQARQYRVDEQRIFPLPPARYLLRQSLLIPAAFE